MHRISLVLLGILESAACTSTSAPQPEGARPQAAASLSPDETKTERPSNDDRSDPPLTGPLHFIFTDFHFEMGGTAVFEVKDRQVRDLFVDSRQEVRAGEPVTVMSFRLAEYELDEGEAARLRKAVTGSDFWNLAPAYINEQIDDGTSQDFIVVVGDARKRVHAYQKWPPPLDGIRNLVRALQVVHQPERDAAREVTPSEADPIRAAARELIPAPAASAE